jgi:MFS family permease
MTKYKAWFICLIAACFFSYELVQLHMLNALSPHIMKDMGLNALELGTLSSSYLLADVIFLIPAGLIIDRFSVRGVILGALFFCIMGTFGFALSQNLLQASISHFFSGIGNAFCFLSCMMLANSWFKDKSTFVMSLMVTVGLLGAVMAQVPFSIMAEKLSWRNTLYIDAFIGCGIWCLSYLFIYEAQDTVNMKKASWDLKVLFTQLKQAFRVKETWQCGFYTGLMNLPLMIISAMVGNLFLTQVHGFTDTKASLAISMISIGTIVGSSCFGWLSEKIGSKKQFMIYGALSSCLIFMSLFLFKKISLEMMMTILFFMGFLSATQVLGYPLITESAPKEAKGTAMGLSALIIMGIAFILQPVTGLLLDWHKIEGSSVYTFYDFARAFSIFPIAFFISFVIALKIKEKKKEVFNLSKNIT